MFLSVSDSKKKLTDTCTYTKYSIFTVRALVTSGCLSITNDVIPLINFYLYFLKVYAYSNE